MTQRTALLAISLAFLACSDGSSNNNNNNEEVKGNSLLLNFTSVYPETGELRWMNPDSTALSFGALSFDHDSKVFASGANIFVLESGLSNISCIPAEKIGGIISQDTLEKGTYPYEVAVAGNTGYITFNAAITDYIQTFNINTCAIGEKINLPIPQANAASVKASGDTLLVLSQRLDGYTATKPGLLIRINTGTKALIDTITLKFYNPHSAVLSDGKLYVSSQGAYNADYSVNTEVSGVEAVDLSTGTSEIIAAGVQLGGGSNGLALDKTNQILYVSVFMEFGDQPVKPVNLTSKIVGAALPNITDSFGGLVFDDVSGKLFVGDRDFSNPGVKIYNPATGATTPVSGGDPLLPPSSLAIVRW